MNTVKDTLQSRFAKDLQGLDLTKEQAYIHLKTKYALKHVGTREYDKIVRKITDFLEL